MGNAMSDEEKAFWSDWTPEELARLKSIRNEMVRNWLAAGAPHGPAVVFSRFMTPAEDNTERLA
jgi:hypothetical protein